ncbi:MAG: hypothetical protein A2836_02235 [Candidatus Taylorbacteria bacterium RIFCSPHIGHO2_01_FULL_45_63]|uniref:Uncharacterized protein n=1 Tax=Candidatus Taylorbacteria bacterium RIFCSPHIGHO2_02_FULL_45_35 TaxID=1802311 RepID=A0A1G2MQI6_9BACT|nr:MAG: hypothetical protein A2836_02235 [Candidatus Taylorbacteria bacterium RIFCSPHIGHO2_01_FULL_45_63]OHA26160.1 MAG: hypothetical protein A3D56_00465 [Candidatus Taylorbacteria bacterium RIFCSPHIGHO2_02_FULL_45_35]OHA32508.1 MAG: hypothetical protein A3A22_00665 [Candidatus Taylorbacteria bacterium RIFCSPLOWO2_01_FULL_45_34b]
MKTIFVTMPNVSVFRNLYFFPKSFFNQLEDALKLKKDTRVVFLVHKGDYEKYIWFFKPHLSDRVIVEEVLVDPKKNIWRKFFRFLYAYLVYTGTTKVLTTMGMRVDDPPAAANRHVFIIRILLANTFGRSRFVKRKVVPFLYPRVFTERPFEDLFTRYKPRLIFTTNLYGEFDTFLLAEAKRRGVKSIGMLANWDHVDKYFLPLQSDVLLVQNEQVKSAAYRYQAYENHELKCTGYPYFDFIIDPHFVMKREDILAHLGFPAAGRYILYISGTAYCPDEPDVIENILSWIDQGVFGPNIHLVLRPYLGGRSKDKEFDRKKFEGFKNHPRVRFYTEKAWNSMSDAVNFMNVMRHASVVMTVYSTAFLEAAVLDRPLVAAVFDGYHKRPYHRSIRRFEEFEHFKDFIKTGAIKRTFSFEQLKYALAAYLKNPAIDADKRAYVREKVCYKLDGHATKRTLDFVLDMLDNSAEASPK